MTDPHIAALRSVTDRQYADPLNLSSTDAGSWLRTLQGGDRLIVAIEPSKGRNSEWAITLSAHEDGSGSYLMEF